MFVKIGDQNPIAIVEPADVDDKSTKKAFDKVVKEAEENQEETIVKGSKE